MPKISVIVTCFNYGKYIDEAISSVLDQTYQDFEIIIVNDGSTDEFTNKKLKDYNKPKTKVIHTKNNGVSIARNIAIKEAQGEYILPLDADDKIAPEYIQKALDIFNNKEVDIVYCKLVYFGASNFMAETPEYSSEKILFDNLVFSSAIFRKSLWTKVGGYKQNMLYGAEDYDFWLSATEEQAIFYRIPEGLFYYRIKDDSRDIRFTSNIDHVHKMFMQIFENHKELFVKNILVLYEKILELKKNNNDLQAELKKQKIKTKKYKKYTNFAIYFILAITIYFFIMYFTIV